MTPARTEKGLRAITARLDRVLDAGVGQLRHRLRELEKQRQHLRAETAAVKKLLRAIEAEISTARRTAVRPESSRRRRSKREMEADRHKILALIRRSKAPVSISDIRQHVPFASPNDMAKLVAAGDVQVLGSRSGAKYSVARGS